MKRLLLILAFCTFNIANTSSEPQVFDLAMDQEFSSNNVESGYYHFRIEIHHNEEMKLITKVTKSPKIHVSVLYTESYPSDDFLITANYNLIQDFEYDHTGNIYTQTYKLMTTEEKNKYLCISIYIPDNYQDLTVNCSTNSGIALSLLILFIIIPCICVTFITVYILRKCFGILGGNNTTSLNISDSYSQGQTYVPPGQGLY